MDATVRKELYRMLDARPHNVERLLTAVRDGRINGGTFGVERPCGKIGCVAGHLTEDPIEAMQLARPNGRLGSSPVESFVFGVYDRDSIAGGISMHQTADSWWYLHKEHTESKLAELEQAILDWMIKRASTGPAPAEPAIAEMAQVG